MGTDYEHNEERPPSGTVFEKRTPKDIVKILLSVFAIGAVTCILPVWLLSIIVHYFFPQW